MAKDSDTTRRARQLTQARRAADECRRCEVWKYATQTVFGQGPPSAALMLVGEEPGDVEDRTGQPFVGPAGQLLIRALAEAGLGDTPRYMTNAVKHFKWEARGKRRIHKKPRVSEITACGYWLDQELRSIKPRVVVVLGATAARAVLGAGVSVLKNRGRWFESPAVTSVMVTVHPASILRSADPTDRREAMAAFVADLKRVARRLRSGQ